MKFHHIGKDVTIWSQAKIAFPELISIGNSVIIDDFVFIMGSENMSLGSFVHIASFASITGGGHLIMEDFVGLSSGGRIFTGDDDYLGNGLTGPTVPARFRRPIRSFVHVKKHVVIGANTVVLPGVTIGEGATIGANSLVKNDCEPWTVYAGTPARPIRPRESKIILEMEKQLRSELYDEQGHYIEKSLRHDDS